MKTTKDFHPGWQITRAQYGRYWRMMSDSAAALNITQNEARERIHTRAFGENKSAKLINHKKDFDKLEAEWAAILKPAEIKPQLRSIDQDNIRTRVKIKTEYIACLAVLLPIKYGHCTLIDVKDQTYKAKNELPNFSLAEQYLKTVLTDRFKITITREGGFKAAIDDLSTTQPTTDNSQLTQFRNTIARAISSARQKIGLTVHDLNVLAGIACDCAECRLNPQPSTLNSVLQPHHQQLLNA